MRNILMLSILAALTIFGRTANAQCTSDDLPLKAESLIGTKLPPKIVNMTPESIPGFSEVNGALLIDTGEKNSSVVAYSEGVLEGVGAIFFLERIFPDRTKEILDARLLPARLLDWQLVNGSPRAGIGAYRLSNRCRTNDKDDRIILGLVKPERGKDGCAHFSRHVKQAWIMDAQSQCLTSITTQNLKCEYITMSECY